MALHRALGEHQPVGDLPVGQGLGDQPDDLPFPFRERVRRANRPARPFPQLGGSPPGPRHAEPARREDLVASVVTTVLYAVALVLGTTIRAVNYYGLLLLLLGGPIERLVARVLRTPDPS